MKIRFALCLIVVPNLVFSSFYAAARVRGAQHKAKERMVARLPVERNEPVRIRAVRIKGVKVSHRQRFPAEDDWLHGLSVTILNRTTRTSFLRLSMCSFRDRWD